MEKKKIVVMGGGTGTSIVLKALRSFDVELTAIVSMADDGGSSGALRRELGVLPPGDVRQCLLSLANTSPTLEDLFRYRFTDGTLEGHNAGNLILAGLEKSSGNFEEAIKTVGEMLQVQGQVIPVTLERTTLGVIHGPDHQRVFGEHVIDDNLALGNPHTFFLEPRATINPRAAEAITSANVIIIGPGSLATSLIPVLIVDGVKEAIAGSKAKLIYNTNLVATPGQTDTYTPADFVRDMESYLPRPFDAITHDADFTTNDKRFIKANLRSQEVTNQIAGDPIIRSTTNHDTEALGTLLMDIINTL